MLEDYLTHTRNTSYIKAIAPAATGVALYVIGTLAAKVVVQIYEALSSIDPLESFKELSENMTLAEPKKAALAAANAAVKKEQKRRFDAGLPSLSEKERYAFMFKVILDGMGPTAYLVFPQLALLATSSVGS